MTAEQPAEMRARGHNHDVPTVLIIGDADGVEREEVLRRELVGRVRGAKIVIMPGVGHCHRRGAIELSPVISRALEEILARISPSGY